MEPDLLGGFLQKRRKELGISQRQLASRCAISHSYVANLERGFDYATGRRTRPTLDMLQKIARGLEVPTEELVRLETGAGKSSPPGADGERQEHLRYPITQGEQEVKRAAEQVGIYFSGFDEPSFWQRTPEARRHAFRYLEGLIDEVKQLRHGSE